jgi:hypothetical protein
MKQRSDQPLSNYARATCDQYATALKFLPILSNAIKNILEIKKDWLIGHLKIYPLFAMS